MRDGLISLLAGNLRGSWSSMLPVLAFKGVYHAMSLAMRLGHQPPAPAMAGRMAAAE